ncbi:MAG: hypothetical protein JXR36_00150 [Bacteroidales bacterium]|nr:hypothetical protein [Bacteroidales bacterium]
MKRQLINLKSAKYLSLLFCLLLTVIIQVQSFSQDLEYFETISTKDLLMVKIKNNNSQKQDLHLKINNKVWYSNDELLQKIKEQNFDSISGIKKGISDIFLFCIKQSTHFPLVQTEESQIISPLEYINSIGYGVCDDRSMFLAQLLSLSGYQCKIVHLGGHSVCEVLNFDKPIILDITNNCVISNSKGELLSLKHLENCIDCKMLNITQNFELRQVRNYLDQTRYFNLYKTTENNNSKLVESPEISSTAGINLPHKSIIEIFFPTKKTNGILPKLKFCITYNDCQQIVNIPFVIASINGKGSIKSEQTGQTFKSGDKNIPSGTYEINAKKLVLELNLNPAILSQSTNYFSVSGEKISELKITVKYSKMNQKEFSNFPTTISQSKLDSYIDLFSTFTPQLDTTNKEIFLNLLNISENVYYKIYHHIPTDDKIKENIWAFERNLNQTGIKDEELQIILKHQANLKSIVIGLIEYKPEDLLLLLRMKEEGEKHK